MFPFDNPGVFREPKGNIGKKTIKLSYCQRTFAATKIKKENHAVNHALHIDATLGWNELNYYEFLPILEHFKMAISRYSAIWNFLIF